MATPTTITLEAGLGGSYKQTLINAAFNCGFWPLAETRWSTIRDFSDLGFHGALSGSGHTLGVSVPLPEDALGMTLDGNGQVDVPDDSAAGNTSFNLSLAAGSVDVSFLIKTTTNDANTRGIINKYDGTNGWYVYLASGKITFGVAVSGVTVFVLARGSVSDGQWHVVHCCYEPEQNRARIFIDGAQSGTAVTGTTEPQVTSANLAIGGWSTLSASSTRFVGTLSMVMISREGNPNLCPALQTCRAWTSLNTDLRLTATETLQLAYGIRGTSLTDNMAAAGTLSFALDNTSTNSGSKQGYYSPGHANCRSGWRIGVPVRFSITFGGTTYYKFRGIVRAIKPSTGQHRDQSVEVTVTDWLDVAARSTLTSLLTTQTGETSGTVFGRVVDQADVPPAAISFDTGNEGFPYAVDTADGTQTIILSELARIVASEHGYAYIKGDTTQGGTLVFEARRTREGDTTDDATLNDTMSDLDISYDYDQLVNIVQADITLRQVDAAATTVLYAMQTSATAQAVVAGDTVTIDARYRDPNQRAASVGGTSMVTPVATTDYTMNTASDGSGTDLTSSFIVDADLGASGATIRVTNGSASTGYITKLQLRGKGIYQYERQSVESRDSDSVRKHGPKTVSMDLPYISDIVSAKRIGDMALALFTEQVATPIQMSFVGNKSTTLLTYACALEPGSRVRVQETMTGLNAAFYVQNVNLTLEQGSIVRASYGLQPSIPSPFWVVGITGFSELGTATRLPY